MRAGRDEEQRGQADPQGGVPGVERVDAREPEQPCPDEAVDEWDQRCHLALLRTCHCQVSGETCHWQVRVVDMTRPYHHGDLRRTLLAAAVDAIAESGPTALSLRDLARRAGVSHAAPAHHFGDKAGLLTALAAEGYELLGEALETAVRTGDFAE